MAEINLPDLSLIWSSAGDILKPSDAKIQQGWLSEVPPRQWFNWLDNRQDEAIAHIAQHGIAVWSDTLEYQAGKSYVQGSDGIVYKAITTNTNINPVGNVGDWESAFVTINDVYTKSQVDAKTAISSIAQAQGWSDNTTLISPLRLNNALEGSNQSRTSNGYQKFPGGLIVQWGQAVTDGAGFAQQVLPVAFPIAHLQATCVYQSGTRNAVVTQIASLTQTEIQMFASNATTGSAAVSATIKWVAYGF